MGRICKPAFRTPAARFAGLLASLRWFLFAIVVLVSFAIAWNARGDVFQIGDLVASRTSTPSPLLTVSVRIIGTSGIYRTYGTGTVIQSEPCVILTAAHVYDGGSYVAEWTDGTRYPIAYLAGERQTDLAIFSCPQGSGRPAVAIASDSPGPNDWTWTIGSDQGAALSERQGKIISTRGNRNLESSAVAVSGRSGGGVFGSSGALVGVISARDPGNGNATIATSCQSILDFLHRNRGRCPNGICPGPQQPPGPNQPSPNPQPPPMPAPAPIPTYPAPVPTNPEFEALKKRVKYLEDQYSALTLSKGPPGDRGDRGNAGEKGDKGDRGDKGDKGDTPKLDDAFIAEVVAKLPPLYIGAKDAKGKITMKATPVKLGQDVFIQIEPPSMTK